MEQYDYFSNESIVDQSQQQDLSRDSGISMGVGSSSQLEYKGKFHSKNLQLEHGQPPKRARGPKKFYCIFNTQFLVLVHYATSFHIYGL